MRTFRGTGRLEGDDDDDDTPAGSAANNPHDHDADGDNDSRAAQNKDYHDGDDGSFVAWGQAAAAVDRHGVERLVRHYYAAVLNDDGKTACRFIYVLTTKVIPEDYGQAPGPPAIRGKTCAVVLTKLFRIEHAKLVRTAASPEVTDVRVQGDIGRVLLGSATMPASYLQVHREGGAWKVQGILAVPLP